MHCFSSRVTSWLTWTLRVGGFVLRRRIGAAVIRPSHLGGPTQQQRRAQEAVAVLWSQTIPWDRHRQIERKFCTIVGGVYAFDCWMARVYPDIRFERYADDTLVHCGSEAEAQSVLEAIRGRLAECGLELHPTKTRIVYCKDDDRPGKYEHVAFDFLGYPFQPRRAKNRWGRYFISFLPAISTKAATAIRQTIRNWRMASTRNNQRLEDLARLANPAVRGWLNYYGRFYRWRCVQVLRHFNEALGKWAQRKYTRFRRRERAAMHWLGRIACRDPTCLSC